MPPGRTPIVTRRTTDEHAAEVWEFVRKQVAQGRQAYLVYPVIEGSKDDQPELDFPHDEEQPTQVIEPFTQQSSKSSAKTASKRKSAKNDNLFATTRKKLRSATEMFDELRTGALAGLRLGLLHGRLSADEKEVTMARFHRGEIDVLVSTTVIEVGVDVANASVMVIDHAERFGLAQMHQLRGRVGRGAAKSFCILMTGENVTEQADARLNAMVATQDGFALAELDLQQRGPGEFFGTRQTGLPSSASPTCCATAPRWSWPKSKPNASPRVPIPPSRPPRSPPSGPPQTAVAAPVRLGRGIAIRSQLTTAQALVLP